MAVTLTRAALALELRIITSEADAIEPGQAAVLDRLLATATALVDGYAPDAPVELANESAVRIAGYLFDRAPHEGRGGNPLILSGAAFLLSRFRTRTITVPTARSEAVR